MDFTTVTLNLAVPTKIVVMAIAILLVGNLLDNVLQSFIFMPLSSTNSL